MQLQDYKSTFAGGWVLTACLAGFVVGVTSISGWFILAALAVVPPLVMLRFWRDPPETLSESINEARR